MVSPLYLIRCAFVGYLLVCSGCSDGVAIRVQTNSGVIEGREADGIRRYLGIPYAQPPVADLRWRPPLPLPRWEGVREALEFGPWCPQPDFDRLDEGELYSGKGLTVFLDVPPEERSSEDCLSLNVWSPADASDSPVMLFIHGNALGSSFPLFDGSAFARDGIVFVSVNFRLYTMGHFAHPALTQAATEAEPLNRYMELDLLAALGWIRENIAAFGGDAGNVTVFGQSNGGAAVLKLLTNKDAEGLFHKAIVQSGNGWWEPMQMAQHEQIGCMLASMAGLNGCDATANELRAVPWKDWPATGPYSLDGRTWRKGATELIAAGEAIDVPLLIGWNDFDGSSLRFSPQEVIKRTPPDVLATYSNDASETEEDLAYSIYTDLHSGAPARWIAHQLEEGAPTYLYLFTHVPWVFRGNIRGAEHGMEFPYAFDTWDAELPPVIGSVFIDGDDETMTNTMHACWVSFARDSKPRCPDSPDWPAYKRSSDQLMQLKVSPTVLSGFRAEQLNAHEKAMQIYLDRTKTNLREIMRDGIVRRES